MSISDSDFLHVAYVWLDDDRLELGGVILGILQRMEPETDLEQVMRREAMRRICKQLSEGR